MTKEIQKTIVRLPKELHEKIRQEAFDRRISINSILIDILINRYKTT